MPSWELLGPKIPALVWRSVLLRADGFDADARTIRWSPMGREAEAWRRFDARDLPDDARVLLLIHGTGMTTRSGFAGITEAEYLRLERKYDGRILAYEHRAFAHHLDWNARDLCHALPESGVHLNLDVVGMSRGGLVARYISEGWAGHLMRASRVAIRTLVFLGTPNGGTPSARRDPPGLGARLMKAWRTDARRVALVDMRSRAVERHDDPYAIDVFDPDSLRIRTWPMLLGSQDQLPASRVLRMLNGFAGPPPDPPAHPTAYFGVASIFDFEHGAPDPVLVGGRRPHRRSDVVRHALPVTNDLVVPTASVYAPILGPHGPPQFPLRPSELMVLGPQSNTSHTGLLRVDAVRRQVARWLGA